MINVDCFPSVSCLRRRQWTGADAPLPAKMEGAVVRRMLPSLVNVLAAGLAATVTFPGSPVRRLLAREVCFALKLVTCSVHILPCTCLCVGTF